MSSERPNFLSQPVVKNVFIFRNGDPYYEARRVVINQRRITTFETLLREVTGGLRAPFGAVRNIYTPTGGHKVDCLESLKSGAQYVAAGREKFKWLDYQEIGTRRKMMMHPKQVKPVPQNRIIVSARFLKPIKEPCPIFVVANGDVLDPALRLLIHPRMLGLFDRILEMITEKMGLKVLGGVRSLYTYEGHQVTDGNQLESGQLYVAVGRERFKKLPYSDLLFTKTRATRRVNGMKAHSLPPIYRFSKQNGNSKSVVCSSNSGDGDSKNSPPRCVGSKRELLSSVVRGISQARLISLRKRRSRQSIIISISDNADLESKAEDGITEDKSPQDQPSEEKTTDDDTKAGEGNSKETGEEEEEEEEEEEAAPKNTTEEDISTGKESKEENQETHCVKERGEEKKENDEINGDATIGSEEREEEEEEEVKEEVTDESNDEKGSIEKKEEVEEEVMEEVTNESKEDLKEQGSSEKEEEITKEAERGVINESMEEVKKHEQGSRSSDCDKTQDSKDKEDGNHPSSEHEMDEVDKNTEEEKIDKESGKGQESSEDQVNDEREGKKQKEMENSNDPGKTDNETRENDSSSSSSSRSSSSNSNQEEDESETREGHIKEAGVRERTIN